MFQIARINGGLYRRRTSSRWVLALRLSWRLAWCGVCLISTMLISDTKNSKAGVKPIHLYRANVRENCLYYTALAKHDPELLVVLEFGSLPYKQAVSWSKRLCTAVPISTLRRHYVPSSPSASLEILRPCFSCTKESVPCDLGSTLSPLNV